MATAQKQEKKDALAVPISQDESLSIATNDKEQIDLIFMPTPLQFVKQREGRGGKTFDYVETNYVIARLNATFHCDWDLEIVEERIFKELGQIATKVRLTVRFLGGKVASKTAWGGSAIKTSKSGDIIDIADDLKSAESDALKKAASMVGICWDVYAGMTNGKDAPIMGVDNIDEGFDDDPRADEDDEEREAIALWIKMHLENHAIDYKDFKLFLRDTKWTPKRRFVGNQFGYPSLTTGNIDDLRYLKENIDKCIDKYLTKRGAVDEQD